MKWPSLLGMVLLSCLHASAQAGSLSGPKRLETLPGDSWMRAPTARLRLAAGNPVSFAPTSQAWLEGSWTPSSSLHVWALVGQLHAAAYSEQNFGLGIRVEGPSLGLHARVHRQERVVETIASELSARAELALVMSTRGFSFGLEQEFPLDHRPARLPATAAYVFELKGSGWVAALMREDSPFEERGVWSAGLELLLAPLSLACRGDGSGGSLHLGLSLSPLNLLLALPLVSSIDAGPYLALELGGRRGREPR